MGNKKNLLHLTKIDFLLDLSEALDGMSELRDCHQSEVAIKGIYELIKKVPTIWKQKWFHVNQILESNILCNY